MRVRIGALVLPEVVERDVVVTLDDSGVVTAIDRSLDEQRSDITMGTAVPGFANTHSHAFHRLLRGRANRGGGDFWEWRTRMYRAANVLEPEDVFDVARLVYDEMRAAGYTAVGEFHYLHHRPDGTPYADHDMELAIAEAAREAGIRLTILDACYLAGGFGMPLEKDQVRFGDGSVDAWLARWHALRDRLATRHPEVVLGAAIHSVRAVPQPGLARAVAGIPADVPLHVHLSEQSAENLDAMAFTGLTPTGLLDAAGALSRRTTVVHATHLTAADTEQLGRAGVFVSICPSTEADLGDGLGMPEPLHAAGARLTIGSDQNVVIDPFAEVRGVEWMERLASHRRGVFSTAELWRMGGVDGHAALSPLAAAEQRLEVGHPLDLVELDPRSPRTLGAHPEELLFSATPADVLSTIIRGRHRSVDAGPAAELDIWERLDRDG